MGSNGRGSCEVRRRLAEEFAMAARLYHEVVTDFVRSVDDDRFLVLKRSIEDAQQRAISASNAFSAHFEKHHCQ
jgi:hypothetical protein